MASGRIALQGSVEQPLGRKGRGELRNPGNFAQVDSGAIQIPYCTDHCPRPVVRPLPDSIDGHYLEWYTMSLLGKWVFGMAPGDACYPDDGRRTRRVDASAVG